VVAVLVSLLVAVITLAVTAYMASRPVIVWESTAERLPRLPAGPYVLGGVAYHQPVITRVSMRYAGRFDLTAGNYINAESGILVRPERVPSFLWDVTVTPKTSTTKEVQDGGYLLRPEHLPSGARVVATLLSEGPINASVELRSIENVNRRAYRVPVSELRTLPTRWERGLSALLAGALYGGSLGSIDRLGSASGPTPNVSAADKVIGYVGAVGCLVLLGVGTYVFARWLVRRVTALVIG
jgi:hypothetical protein